MNLVTSALEYLNDKSNTHQKRKIKGRRMTPLHNSPEKIIRVLKYHQNVRYLEHKRSQGKLNIVIKIHLLVQHLKYLRGPS